MVMVDGTGARLCRLQELLRIYSQKLGGVLTQISVAPRREVR